MDNGKITVRHLSAFDTTDCIDHIILVIIYLCGVVYLV